MTWANISDSYVRPGDVRFSAGDMYARFTESVSDEGGVQEIESRRRHRSPVGGIAVT